MEKPFLIDRTEELNNFMKFMLDNYNTFDFGPL